VSQHASPLLLELRRYAARPDAEIAAWALRAQGVAAELRRVGRPQKLEESGLSALLVPRDAVERAREVLSTDRFKMSDDEERLSSRATWSPASSSEIESGLAEIERRERIARFWRWSFVPVLLLAGFSVREPLSSAMAIIWLAGLGVSHWRAGACDCPRCGLPFGHDSTPFGSWRAAFSRCCLTCGLARRES